MDKTYTLPALPYGYGDLAPHISEKQLMIHHQKHHQTYVDSANNIFGKLEKARREKVVLDIKATLKELSFHVGGHVLHSLFWKNLTPDNNFQEELQIVSAIKEEFGSIERFKEEFTETANTVEGSGWAALTFDKNTKRLAIMQIEKHNLNIYPGFQILLVLDVWEHTYYLDYQNMKAKFVEAFWKIVNWKEVEKRFNNSR